MYDPAIFLQQMLFRSFESIKELCEVPEPEHDGSASINLTFLNLLSYGLLVKKSSLIAIMLRKKLFFFKYRCSGL